MKKKWLAALTLACLLATDVSAFAAEADNGESTVFRKKIRGAAEKAIAQQEKEASDKRKTEGLMPFFVKANEMAKTGKYEDAAKILEGAQKEFPTAKEYDPYMRWLVIYHYRAGHYQDVVFLLFNYKNMNSMYANMLAGSYRQMGMPKKAEAVLEQAEAKLPHEFKVPKKPPEIGTLSDLDTKYPWLAGMFVFSEKTILAYTNLNDSKDAGKVIQAVDDYWRCVPDLAGPAVLPYNDVYGFDLSDVALSTGFVLLANGDEDNAKGMLNWYVGHKKPKTDLDKRLLEEATALIDGMAKKE